MLDSATWFLTEFNRLFTFWGAHKMKIHLPFCVTSSIHHLENYSGDCWCFTAALLNKFLSSRRSISSHISSDILTYSLHIHCSHSSLMSLSLCQEMDLNWPESGVSSCLGHHRLHRAPAPQSRVWPRLSEPRSGEQCACATRDTRNKNTGELETCTAGDYHMLAVIKTSSRNLWLADTGLTLDIRLPSLRFLHDSLRIWAAQPVFGLLSVWSISTQSRSNIVRNKCSS